MLFIFSMSICFLKLCFHEKGQLWITNLNYLQNSKLNQYMSYELTACVPVMWWFKTCGCYFGTIFLLFITIAYQRCWGCRLSTKWLNRINEFMYFSIAIEWKYGDNMPVVAKQNCRTHLQNKCVVDLDYFL